MTPRERLYARLQGKPVDKIPNMNIAMGLVAKMAGASYREYVQDYRKLVEGNLICAEKFGFDTVSVISDPMREAAAFGAQLTFPEHGVPYSETALLSSGYDLERVKITTPLEHPRTLDRIKGVELLHQKVGSQYPIIGWVEGVLAETADLRGVTNLMMDLVDEEVEEDLRQLMEIIHAGQCAFALEQIKAGADVIGVGNAVASLVGPSLYEKFGFKYDKAIIDFIRKNEAKAKLHICGNIEPLIPLLIEASPDILDIDWMVDFSKATEMCKDVPISICGNIDPVAVMLSGSIKEVEEKVLECVNFEDNTTLIAAGCEVPAETPVENLLHMDRLLYF